MERETRLELATPTLARLCSTTELFPQYETLVWIRPLQKQRVDYSDAISFVKKCDFIFIDIINGYIGLKK